jgi:hypothetical protein
MFIIVGGTGRVRSATVQRFSRTGDPSPLSRGTRRKETAGGHEAPRLPRPKSIRDVDALRAVFRRGRHAFLFSPSAAPSPPTDVEESTNGSMPARRLDGSGLEKVVAQSTYGARPGEHCATSPFEEPGRFRGESRTRSPPAGETRGSVFQR